MKVEKRASNKIGLVILLIVVLAGIGCGGYFLFKHKDKLDIDWDLSLPWKKDEEDKEDNDNEEKKSTKQKTNEVTTFKGPSNVTEEYFSNFYQCIGKFEEVKENDKEFIVTFSITGHGSMYDNYCEIDMYKYAVDDYFIPGSTKIVVEPGETKKGEIKMLKSDLEAQELSGINKLTVFMNVKTDKEGEAEQVKIETAFSNERSVKNEKVGIKIDDLNNTMIQYYKTTTDETNTYLYFIITNQSEVDLADIKVRRLLVNDKVYDTKDFDEEIGCETKKLVYIAIPKKTISRVKKFSISFFNISTNIESKEKSFYLSNEYSKEV